MTAELLTAKITRPTLSGVVQRQRLFERLDAGGDKSVTWISAPAGSGKTTLVASYLDSRQLPCLWYTCDERDADLATFFYYMGLAAKKAAPRHRTPLPLLTPEYLAGVPAFTRNYFEQLYRRLARYAHPSFTVVLDNYQEVPAVSPFHDMAAIGFSGIPAGVRVVVISRGELPAPLARLRADDKISLLTYSDIRFTLDEAQELVQGRQPELTRRQVADIYEKAEGWAAGMTLMLERGLRGDAPREAVATSGHDGVFDYFAEEIFNRAKREVQEFLLKTAVLPVVSVPLAEELAATDAAWRILDRLNRHNLFTVLLAGSGQQYQYHPLFRNFLLNRANSRFTLTQVAGMRRSAAKLLEQAGQVEDAARLYCEAKDHDGMVRMIVRHARDLLRQGRNRTVQEWLAFLPGGAVAGNSWIAYWSGMCRFPLDMPGARTHLEQALALFRDQGDAAGSYLTWAGIVDTYLFGSEWTALDGWLDVFEELLATIPFPSPEIELAVSSRMLGALIFRKTEQPLLVRHWLQRVSALQGRAPSFTVNIDTIFHMNAYHLWKGEYDKCRLSAERAEAEISHGTPSPFVAIRVKLMKGIYQWTVARHDAAVATLAEGLAISAQSGVHLFDALCWNLTASSHLVTGEVKLAEEAIEKQLAAVTRLPKPFDLFFYHVNRAWYALLGDNPALAAEHLEAVLEKTEVMGIPYYRALWHTCMAQAAFLLGRGKEACASIRTAHRLSLAMNSTVMEWYALLIEAWMLLSQGKERAGLSALKRGLLLGRRQGYIQATFHQPSIMGFLYATALEKGIEPEYVAYVIQSLRLAPPRSTEGMAPEEWPYPVDIATLGRFEVLLDGRPLAISGKEQKKPLELLKVLISLGGREVPVHRLVDALWPHTEGDLSRTSFEVTLSRLRRLLGGESVIIHRAGHLTLSPLQCRVDTQVLERLIEAIPAAFDDHGAALCDRAVGLYRGPFLPADTGLAWTVSRREAVQGRLLRVIIAVGLRHEQEGGYEQAAGYYAKGIEVNHLAEECHRRLMACQISLGNHSDAAVTWQRCCRLLKDELGIAPSPETTAVYSAIARKR